MEGRRFLFLEAGIATASNQWLRLIHDLWRRLLCPPLKIKHEKQKKIKKPMDRPDKPIHGVSSPSKRRHHGCGLDLRVVTIVVPGSSHTTLDLLSGMMPPPSIRSQRPSTTLIRHRRKPPPLIHCPRMPQPLIHSQRPSTASIHRRRMPPLSIHHPGIPLPSICGWRIGTPGIRH